MEAVIGLTNLQLELLKIFSIPFKEDQLKEIKALLSRYFAEKATEEMDMLWDVHNWSDETMREWAQEHMRVKSKHWCELYWTRKGLIKEDEDDNKFVDYAIAANAKYIVSNDRHFRMLKDVEFPKVDVIGIDGFLESLSE